MEFLNSIFSTLTFTKVNIKDNIVIYAAKISDQLAGGIGRYVVLCVPYTHSQIPDRVTINQVPWVSLQTRTLIKGYKLDKQKWLSNVEHDLLFPCTHRTQTHSIYSRPNFPYIIKLLHNPKRQTIYQYGNNLYLSSILNTFQCVIELPQTTCNEESCSRTVQNDDTIEFIE